MARGGIPPAFAKLIGQDGGELAYLAISDGAEAAAQEGRTDRLVYDGDGSDGIGRHPVPSDVVDGASSRSRRL